MQNYSYQPHDDFFSDEFNVLEEVNKWKEKRKRKRERERVEKG